MIDGKFDVVFRGQTVKGFELTQVKSNLVALFKSSPEAIEKLFSGQEIPIRKSLDYAQAMKYQSALKNAGALALIKEVEQAKEPALKASNEGRASFTTPESPPTNDVTATDKPSNSQSAQPAATGSSANQANQQPSATASESSTAASSADGEMTIAAAGAQILPDKIYEKRDVDTSSLSLAAAGERILPASAPEPDATPDIDHLAITNDTTPISGEREN